MIIFDGRNIAAHDALMKIGDYAGRDKEWLDELWYELIDDSNLMEEFMYYVDHHNFRDEYKCRGYDMTDLYVFQMSRYNLIRDAGKNGASCNKEFLALGAFHDMYQMVKDPERYVKKLSEGPGMDRMM